MAKKCYTVSDELWEKVRPWIPVKENPHPRKGGRKPKEDRIVFHAILFVLHTGSQWKVENYVAMLQLAFAVIIFNKLKKEDRLLG